MANQNLKIDDYCVCLDDPWTDMRQLVVTSIIGKNAKLDLSPFRSTTIELPLSRLVHNPYRNEAARIVAGRTPTSDEIERMSKAARVKIAIANIARDGQPIALEKLRVKVTTVLPIISKDMLELCLRSMVASGALKVVPPKKGESGSQNGSSASKVKIRVSKDMRRSEQLSAFSFSFAEELLSQSRRIGQLVVHRGTGGEYREELLRALLRKSLPERYHVATGFIEGSDLQLDVIVYDRIEYAPVFREGDLVVVPMDSVRAVIEVKTRLTTQTLRDALKHMNSLPIEIYAPFFKGIFAFETNIPDDRILGHIDAFYQGVDSLWGQPFDEIAAICVLDQQLVLTGYGKNPIRPVLSLISNILGRNFHAAGFLDSMQNYLRTPAPRDSIPGLLQREIAELDGSPQDYNMSKWSILMDDGENGWRKDALNRVERTLAWLSGRGQPW